MITNYERIKAMSVDEMAELINCCFCTSSSDYIPCKTCFIKDLCEKLNSDYMTMSTDKAQIKQWLESETDNANQ